MVNGRKDLIPSLSYSSEKKSQIMKLFSRRQEQIAHHNELMNILTTNLVPKQIPAVTPMKGDTLTKK